MNIPISRTITIEFDLSNLTDSPFKMILLIVSLVLICTCIIMALAGVVNVAKEYFRRTGSERRKKYFLQKYGYYNEDEEESEELSGYTSSNMNETFLSIATRD